MTSPASAPTPPDSASAGARSISLVVAALLAIGVAVRIAVSFPIHEYFGDADCVFNGLIARRILEGHPYAFEPGATRIGALPAYLVAALFWIFGDGRGSLAASAVLVGSLQMWLGWRFLVELLGTRRALAGLPFVVLPTPVFLVWAAYRPTNYPLTLALATAALWLAARIARRGASSGWLVAYGLVAGLGLWTSFLTLTVTSPATLWLVARRRELLAWRRAAFACAGFVAGAAPWIVFNLGHGFASVIDFTASANGGATTSVAQSVERLASYGLPELFASPDGFGAARARVAGPPEILRWAAWLLPIASLAILGTRLLRRRSASAPVTSFRGESAGDVAPAFVLALLVAGTVLVASFSPYAASRAGTTVRFLLPLALVLPLLSALAFATARGAARTALALLMAGALAWHAGATHWPWTAERREWRDQLERNRSLYAALVEHRIDVVVGSYWRTYPLDFDLNEKVRGVPARTEEDYLEIGNDLPSGALRWAFADREDRLRAFAARTGIPGEILAPDPRHAMLLPADSWQSSATAGHGIEVLRKVYLSAGRQGESRLVESPP